MSDDPYGTLPLFDAPPREQVAPATLREQAGKATPKWRSYTGWRVACDECVTYLHQHGGKGPHPHPRSARRERILGAQRWRLCPQHADPREQADRAAAEAAAARAAHGGKRGVA